jgi:hypothetical protein
MKYIFLLKLNLLCLISKTFDFETQILTRHIWFTVLLDRALSKWPEKIFDHRKSIWKHWQGVIREILLFCPRFVSFPFLIAKSLAFDLCHEFQSNTGNLLFSAWLFLDNISQGNWLIVIGWYSLVWVDDFSCRFLQSSCNCDRFAIFWCNSFVHPIPNLWQMMYPLNKFLIRIIRMILEFLLCFQSFWVNQKFECGFIWWICRDQYCLLLYQDNPETKLNLVNQVKPKREEWW